MILNKKRIADLRELELETEEKIISSLTQLFERDMPSLMKTLEERIAEGDFLQAGKIAHKIKTSCANLGITDGYEICLELETQCKKMNQKFRYKIHLKRLEKIIFNSIKELEQELKSAA